MEIPALQSAGLRSLTPPSGRSAYSRSGTDARGGVPRHGVGRAPLRGLARRLGRGFAGLAAAACLAACSGASAAPVVTVHSARGDAAVEVELALTREQQARGLMYRTELAEDAGMLFVFDGDAERTFWMSNTPRSLDILYIRSDSTIVSIAANTTPYSEKQIPSRGPARYVLEVNAGWSAAHGVKPGDKVTLPDVPAAQKGD